MIRSVSAKVVIVGMFLPILMTSTCTWQCISKNKQGITYDLSDHDWTTFTHGAENGVAIVMSDVSLIA